MKRAKVGPAVIIMAFVAMACGRQVAGEGEPADVFFPTYPPDPASPTGLLEGVLAEHNNCLFLENREAGRFLLLWPEGYRPVNENGRIHVLDASGQVVGGVGDTLSVGGGERDFQSAVDITGEEVPPRCQEEDLYWLVSEVLVEPPP